MLFAGFNPVANKYADTVAQAGGFLAQLSREKPLLFELRDNRLPSDATPTTGIQILESAAAQQIRDYRTT